MIGTAKRGDGNNSGSEFAKAENDGPNLVAGKRKTKSFACIFAFPTVLFGSSFPGLAFSSPEDNVSVNETNAI